MAKTTTRAKEKRPRKQPTEYQKLRREFRKNTPRHVLEVELSASFEDIVWVLGVMEKLRKAGNEVVGIMRGRIDQLFRRRAYRDARKEYAKAKRADDADRMAAAKETMESMRVAFGVTKDECVELMRPRQEKYGLTSVIALSRAEEIWGAIEDVVFRKGKDIRFKKRGDLPAMRAKQYNKEIIVKTKKSGELFISYAGKEFPLRAEKFDAFQKDEIARVVAFLEDAKGNEAAAIEAWQKGNKAAGNTFRPCFAAIVVKDIRGKNRLFVQITVEGNPLKKQRHADRFFPTQGNVGVDTGAQTTAWTSENECGLINLGERGNSIETTERQARLLLRKLDRQRRANNPWNYDEKGRVKPRKERKPWILSKNYLKTKEKYKSASRIAALNRKYANNETVNHLRTLGAHVITEPPNFKFMQKKAKKPKDGSVKLDKNGKPAKRKHFGKSIHNRCPGGFQSRLRTVFEVTGGTYTEVSTKTVRASQYDHTDGQYKKKDLKVRYYKLADGRWVQRDMYSSFLLSIVRADTGDIDKEIAADKFERIYPMQQERVQYIYEHGLRIFNSGISLKEKNPQKFFAK